MKKATTSEIVEILITLISAEKANNKKPNFERVKMVYDALLSATFT